jgi:hypothetical protein
MAKMPWFGIKNVDQKRKVSQDAYFKQYANTKSVLSSFYRPCDRHKVSHAPKLFLKKYADNAYFSVDYIPELTYL